MLYCIILPLNLRHFVTKKLAATSEQEREERSSFMLSNIKIYIKFTPDFFCRSYCCFRILTIMHLTPLHKPWKKANIWRKWPCIILLSLWWCQHYALLDYHTYTGHKEDQNPNRTDNMMWQHNKHKKRNAAEKKEIIIMFMHCVMPTILWNAKEKSQKNVCQSFLYRCLHLFDDTVF